MAVVEYDGDKESKTSLSILHPDVNILLFNF